VPRFVGGRTPVWESEVLALLEDGKETRGPVREGAQVDVVTAETPFYASRAGRSAIAARSRPTRARAIEVLDTQKLGGKIVVHRGGRPAGRDRGRPARPARDRRRAPRGVALNHSATHLAHAALRHRLGTHVKQAGSLVDPTKLRFDFSHHKAVSADELRAIEDDVNAQIRANADVTSEEMSYDDAVKAGALAFFGDKYGDRVTVVRMGDFSTSSAAARTCGARATSASSRSTRERRRGGRRRLEAVTGAGALDEIRRHEALSARSHSS
jgi:alanyl-tRNA synthetase